MTLWNKVVRWVGVIRVAQVDDASLDAVYERRFRHASRTQFNRLWREVASVVKVSPGQLSESDVLDTLATSSSRFPYTVLDQLSDLVSEESVGVPDRPLRTVGELMDWLLANPRS